MNMATAAAPMPDKRFTLVLIGRKGDGKSATGNTILGKPVFKPSLTSTTGFTPCQVESDKNVHGYADLTVIDTPGLFNTEFPKTKVEEELAGIFKSTPEGIDAFLLVLRLGRFTAELQNTVKYYRELYGVDIAKHTIVVFAGLDDLEHDGETFENYLKNMPQDMKKILPERMVAINNRSSEKKSQAVRILCQVDQMKQKYTKKMLPRKSPLQNFVSSSEQDHSTQIANAKPSTSRQKQKQLKSSKKDHQAKSHSDVAFQSVPESNYLRVAVIGRDADGKSDLVSSLLSCLPSTSETNDRQSGLGDLCTRHTGLIDDRCVLLIDTASLDLESDNNPTAKSLFATVESGFNALVLVLHVNQDKNQELAIEIFHNMFGCDAMRFTVVVFCHSGQIQSGKKGLRKYVKHLPKSTAKMLKRPIERHRIMAYDPSDLFRNETFNEFVKKVTSINKKKGSFSAAMSSSSDQLENIGYSKLPNDTESSSAQPGRKCIIL